MCEFLVYIFYSNLQCSSSIHALWVDLLKT